MYYVVNTSLDFIENAFLNANYVCIGTIYTHTLMYEY